MTVADPGTGEVVAEKWQQQHVLRQIEMVTSRLLGLERIDVEDSLHADLAKAVYELGPGQPDGVVLQRFRWHFVWHLRDAGATYATARADHDHLIDRRTVRLRAEAAKAGEKLSRLEAEQVAKSEDATYAKNLAMLLAEQRERAMRKALDAIDSAIELHRTDRADARRSDTQHGQGMTGGA